jgi:hypothetical protein
MQHKELTSPPVQPSPNQACEDLIVALQQVCLHPQHESFFSVSETAQSSSRLGHPEPDGAEKGPRSRPGSEPVAPSLPCHPVTNQASPPTCRAPEPCLQCMVSGEPATTGPAKATPDGAHQQRQEGRKMWKLVWGGRGRNAQIALLGEVKGVRRGSYVRVPSSNV